MGSNAVGLERVSRVVGYDLTTGDFSTVTLNLPQRIAILAEANDANQTDLDTTPIEITSSQQAGELFGYGSPIHQEMRILRPRGGDGVGGIPTVVFPQAAAGGAAAKVMHLTPTGVATGNGTHTIIVAGRRGIEGVPYDINIVAGDTTAEIVGKVADAINAVLGSPVIVTENMYVATLTSKWKGLTAQDITIEVDTNDGDLGITYAITQIAAGSGTPSIAAALTAFGNQWFTKVVNTYGAVSSIMDALEQFNGKPSKTSPMGRFNPTNFKPFVALTGSLLQDPSTITDARLGEQTIVICPAPGSKGLAMEAAANVCLITAVNDQNTPHLDSAGQSYPDMPTPTQPIQIGSMTDYNFRDSIVKKGCSTVDFVAGRYQIQDLVTTYHPLGEEPPQFRFVRNLTIDFNVRFRYFLLEQISVVDHGLANDADIILVDDVIKPKMWTQILNKLADDLVAQNLIVDASFMQKSITVKIGTSNPDRFETFFKYKRSGFVRIASTVAEAGFNFGTLN